MKSALTALLLSSALWGQVYSSGGPVVNNVGQPVAAQIAVCTTQPPLPNPPTTNPPNCSVYAATYTDATLGTPCTLSPSTLGPISGTGCTNPGKTDSRGNYTVFAPSGIYYIEFYGYGITTYIMPASTSTTAGNFASPPPIGNVTPNTGQFTALNGVYNAGAYSGSDIFAKAQAAFTACSNNCSVWIPTGTYSVSSTLTLNYVTQSLECEQGTVINYTGAGDAIRWQISPFTVTQAGSIKGCTINGTSSGISGIHMGDVIGAELNNVVLQNFTGSSGIGLWFDNVTNWTERSVFYRTWLNNNTKGWRLTNTGGINSTSSFAYTRALDIKLNVNASQTGISMEGGNWYSGTLIATFNVGSASGTVFAISGLQYTGGSNTQLVDTLFDLTPECTACSAGTLMNIPSGFLVSGAGIVANAANSLNNSISGTLRTNDNSMVGATHQFQVYDSLGHAQNAYIFSYTNPTSNTTVHIGSGSLSSVTMPFLESSNTWTGANAFNTTGYLANPTIQGTGDNTQAMLWFTGTTLNSYQIFLHNPIANRHIDMFEPGATAAFGLNLNGSSGLYASKRNVSGCTTGASQGNACGTAITVTWPGSFADANYSAHCSPVGAPTNYPSSPYIVSKAIGSMTVNYIALTAAAASWPAIDCSATHD